MLSEGKLIYLLDERGKRYWTTLQKGMIKVAGLGVIDGERLLGKMSGSKITLAGGREFWVLKPTVNELMESIERGPQVIMPKDAATIVFRLGIRAGETVVEAGLGSGSMTIALANAVGSEGKVISVELRTDHVQKAMKNIERAGFKDNWELRMGDIKTINLGVTVDAVILDIPDPWAAIRNVDNFLKPSRHICAYVPNMNQVETTVKALRDDNYVEIEALENIQRKIEVHEGGVRPSYENISHTGYLVFGIRTTERILSKGLIDNDY